MKRAILTVAVMVIALSVSAAAPKDKKRMAMTEKEKAALTFLTTMRVEQRMQRSFEMVKKMQMGIVSNTLKGVKDQDIANKVNSQVLDMVRKEFSWDNFKDDFMKIYANVYTLDEMQKMTEFFQSKTGQAFLDKSPMVQQQMMPLVQKKVMALIPKVQKLTKECMAKEMKAAKGKSKIKCGCDTHPSGK
ncbi:MAG: DUF2059 domain-containing protein [Lentisphaerae bacterium]|nr:DUF2059 domain-containing protein [Lentisphaerota bacterium]MCP4101087.1 DUF2059 domain-containing protein [Lentisphaerota bacterium]